MVAAAPSIDNGTIETKVTGGYTGSRVAWPIVAVGTASAEEASMPGEASAPKEGERYIFYQSS